MPDTVATRTEDGEFSVIVNDDVWEHMVPVGQEKDHTFDPDCHCKPILARHGDAPVLLHR
jgi:hypothetical protein